MTVQAYVRPVCKNCHHQATFHGVSGTPEGTRRFIWCWLKSEYKVWNSTCDCFVISPAVLADGGC